MDRSAAIDSLLSVAGTQTGDAFFQQVTKEIGKLFGADDVFFAFAIDRPSTRVRVHHIWCSTGDEEAFEYKLEGTPCQLVYNGEPTLIPCDVNKIFPEEFDTDDNSFIGVPLYDPSPTDQEEIIGHLAIYSEKPITEPEGLIEVAQLFGARAQSELQRAHSEEQLRNANASLEENVAALRETQARLADEVATKDRFFSIIAHDLKSPFTPLLGMTDMMVQMSDSLTKQQFVEYARGINVSGKRVFQLLENLLEWARLQMSRDGISPDDISIHEVVDHNLAIFDSAAEEKSIELVNQVPPLTAFAEANSILLVVRNLLANAVKFTPLGGRIVVSAVEQEDMIEVSVSDTGIGVDPGVVDGIFAIDQKTTKAGTGGEVGSGLGLPLCCELIELNGGVLWYESEIGNGTTFFFTVPKRP